MKTEEPNKAIQMFYATGVVMGIAAFFAYGLHSGNWAVALFASAGGGLGFGLVMHGILSLKN